MADQKVSKAQMLDLLGRLANDDGFRSRFEKNPSAALAEVGIPPDQIKGFPEDHTRPGMLAPKPEFEAARKRLIDQAGDECLCMIIPGLRLDFDDHN
ncbi:MAG TPA: NHLP-related RiPP peptide [Rudaea sp.]|jgi:putative modified peptide|nr:NHLP-related RiPP peptide [Rudaea sp.]